MPVITILFDDRPHAAEPLLVGRHPGRGGQHADLLQRARHPQPPGLEHRATSSYRVTEPALRPIRRVLPNLGPIDISPLILLILIYAAEALLSRIHAAIVYGNVRGLLL